MAVQGQIGYLSYYLWLSAMKRSSKTKFSEMKFTGGVGNNADENSDG